jgi:ABC-type transporter Mla MlaB component
VEIVCDLSGLAEIDARTVDALARLQLAAQRLDAHIVLRNAPRELVELLDFFGLTAVLPSSG